MTTRRFIQGAVLCSALFGCEQPRPKCTIARGPFAASYELLDETSNCATVPGDLLWVETYVQPRSPSDPRPDYDRTSLSIQPNTVTGLLSAEGAQPHVDDTPYALGTFAAARPDGQDFCSVPVLSTARVRLPASTPTDMCAEQTPAVDLSYEFTNLRVYVTPGAYGTQFSADLTYTADGCVARYRVRAVYPAVSCDGSEMLGDPSHDPANPSEAGMPDVPPGNPNDAAIMDRSDAGLTPLGMDASVEPFGDAGTSEKDAATLEPSDGEVLGAGDAACPPPAEEPAHEPVVNEALCSPFPDPALGLYTGSGINVDFAVRCDPELLFCVLRKDPPSLR